ncbi:MAG TPA: YciI family protein [Rhodanobacter sp.]|nr:YciI family protein [Rhodanobacter sp.]
MRFLSMVRINERSGQKPGARLMEDMGRLMAELTAAGSLLDTAGLQPTSQGKRVRLSRGRQTVIDGPFTEAKEVIGGYAMLQAASMDEALALTRRFLEVHGDEWEIECEVRQVMEDCSEAA